MSNPISKNEDPTSLKRPAKDDQNKQLKWQLENMIMKMF